MPTVILVRHGRSTANTAGVLAGRTPGIFLDDTGKTQVGRTGERLAAVPLAALVTSPLERCRQTAQAILDAQTTALTLITEDGLLECDYGDWQNRKITDLTKEPLWTTVTDRPSRAVFPGGESLSAMQERAVQAVRTHDAAVLEQCGQQAVWAAVTHGDIIKSVIADAYGMPFDHFQRVHANPASVSIIHYPENRNAAPHVLAVNTEAGALAWLRPQLAKETTAEVGGGAGHDAAP